MPDHEGWTLLTKENKMGIQGIEEALEWAFNAGRSVERDRQLIGVQGERIRELTRELDELKPKFLKLAEDFQGLVKENERVVSASAEQAVTLTTEIEGLKERYARMGFGHLPMEAPKPT